MLKQISYNEIYLLIRYIKSVLWRVAEGLSYIEDARCLKFKGFTYLMIKELCWEAQDVGTSIELWLKLKHKIYRKCTSATPIVLVLMLDSTYEIVCESEIMCGIEVWGLSGAWKEQKRYKVYIFQETEVATEMCSHWFCQEGTWKFRRDNCIVKCWHRIVCLDTKYSVKLGYGRRVTRVCEVGLRG